MNVTAQQYRYHFPPKAIKADCPECAPKHRKTLSRYVDGQTGEPLPLPYGRCDRESNCGYHLSPYHKGPSGMSYADNLFEQGKEARQPVQYHRQRPKPIAKPTTVYSIPNEVFTQSLGHYERNQFARLLNQQFGQSKANALLQQFQIGTSARWPGACVFWYIDERNRNRGGQIKLFADDWHTVKYTDHEGKKRAKVDWVHTALKLRLQKAGTPLPDWLQTYVENAERSPCLFGLPQLTTAPKDQPVAIVEAPKTAVICSGYVTDFVWLAVGAKSYLNAERLAPVRGRRVVLYPDLNAYTDWSERTDRLRAEGFTVEVSSYLEENATDEQKQTGLDLADYLLQQPPTVSTISEQLTLPGSILRPDESQLDRLAVEPCDTYPPEWDAPNETHAKPIIKALNFFEWQLQHKDFSRLGINSLNS